jgi:hypothetical protein
MSISNIYQEKVLFNSYCVQKLTLPPCRSQQHIPPSLFVTSTFPPPITPSHPLPNRHATNRASPSPSPSPTKHKLRRQSNTTRPHIPRPSSLATRTAQRRHKKTGEGKGGQCVPFCHATICIPAPQNQTHRQPFCVVDLWIVSKELISLLCHVRCGAICLLCQMHACNVKSVMQDKTSPHVFEKTHNTLTGTKDKRRNKPTTPHTHIIAATPNLFLHPQSCRHKKPSKQPRFRCICTGTRPRGAIARGHGQPVNQPSPRMLRADPTQTCAGWLS